MIRQQDLFIGLLFYVVDSVTGLIGRNRVVLVLKPIGFGQCGVLQEPGCPRDDRAFVWDAGSL